MRQLIAQKLNQPAPSAAPGMAWVLAASVMVFLIIIVAVLCFGGANGSAS